MQILIAVLATGVAAIQTPSFNARITRSEPVLVRSVIDGDTIDVTAVGRVRLLGIDAPEIGRGFDTSAPFGREARERLTTLILHRWVRIEQEGPALDLYNRHLGYVMTEDGTCVNTTLVREGLARVSARTPLARLQELQRAESEAQAFRRGMWGSTPQIPAPSYTRPSGASRPPRSQRSRTKAPSTRRRTTRKKKP
jgi:endonuclease YncB( thermonuclease family)